MSVTKRYPNSEKSGVVSRCMQAYGLACLFVLLGLFGSVVPLRPAFAIPPFARQTGLNCNVCHTVYPQLTPFGRQFKLNGYTMGKSVPIYEKLGAWLQGSFDRTNKDQTDPPAEHFATNNNFVFDDASLFYGGRLVGDIGAFLQGTYDGIGRVWTWDNMDVRYAHNTTINGNKLLFGVSVNNNPGVQDVYNTMPAWSFPFDNSGLAPSPAAAPFIEGTLGQISAGASVYGMWNNRYYAEVGAYHTLASGANDLLADTTDAPKSDGLAPYWRFVWTPDVGKNSLSLGTFGIHAALFPDSNQTSSSDSYTDIGLDSQYQYFGERYSATTRVSFIQEFQDLSGSVAIGSADHTSNELHKINASGSFTWDKTYSGTLGIAHTWGTSDATFYGTPTGSPDSTAMTVQGDWLPLNKSPWSVYPWFNPRLTAQYTHYFQFDGSSSNVDGAGRHASDNDTLFLLATLTL
jgi:hypothetical protein